MAIAPGTERAILDDPAPFSRSMRICCDHLRAILGRGPGERLSLGINVEASVALVHALREVASGDGPAA